MARETIDFGIDLGTTNSTVAVLRNALPAVIRDNGNRECTPSAVWIDKRGALRVGEIAKAKLEDDPGNAVAEFKLRMGSSDLKHFEGDGRRMRPEELSAEVLKELRKTVQQQLGEDMTAAVIGVPAAFDSAQTAATNAAARLAGIEMSPLVQEPVAAATAYGFQSEQDKVFWLVYDFGGGTFDAAIIQIRDGMIHVVNHAGDNHLGGKLIDREIVDQLFIPRLTREYRLDNFVRGEPRWRSVFAKLKAAAEAAKIQLSRDDVFDVDLPSLGADDAGTNMDFTFEIRQSELARLAEPFVIRSVNLCKRALAEKKLGAGDVGQILLVGGPTMAPYLRAHVADAAEGLGIPLNFSVDPLTVVAQGAAIYAGSQRIERAAPLPTSDHLTVALEYKPVGVEVDPLVGGRVHSVDERDLTGYTIEFVNAMSRPAWRSGKIPLSAQGTFMTNLWAERAKANTFGIELSSRTGQNLRIKPDSFTYTVGIVIADPPLSQSVGVAMANNEMDVIFAKGTPLPAKKRVVHRTAVAIKKGDASSVLRIPIVEGDSIRRADRNQNIGELVLAESSVRRDLPAGSEVEISFEIDTSRLIRVTAYIPLLDEELEGVMHLEKPAPDAQELTADVRRERKRFESVAARTMAVGDSTASGIVQRLGDERAWENIDAGLRSAAKDRDTADEVQARVLNVRKALDSAEDALEWPALVVESGQHLTWAEEVVAEHGSQTDRESLEGISGSLKAALAARDVDSVRLEIDHLDALRFTLLVAQPSWWVGYFAYIREQRAGMEDQQLADKWLAHGGLAMERNDLEALKVACNQLVTLLPRDQQEEARGYGGTTVRE